MVIRFKRLRPGAIIPERGTPESAGLDLSACLEGPLILKAGETALVPTGLAAELPQGTAGMVYARSGLAAKLGIALANGVGVGLFKGSPELQQIVRASWREIVFDNV